MKTAGAIALAAAAGAMVAADPSTAVIAVSERAGAGFSAVIFILGCEVKTPRVMPDKMRCAAVGLKTNVPDDMMYK